MLPHKNGGIKGLVAAVFVFQTSPFRDYEELEDGDNVSSNENGPNSSQDSGWHSGFNRGR
jgi:hypothetical protein